MELLHQRDRGQSASRAIARQIRTLHLGLKPSRPCNGGVLPVGICTNRLDGIDDGRSRLDQTAAQPLPHQHMNTTATCAELDGVVAQCLHFNESARTVRVQSGLKCLGHGHALAAEHPQQLAGLRLDVTDSFRPCSTREREFLAQDRHLASPTIHRDLLFRARPRPGGSPPRGSPWRPSRPPRPSEQGHELAQDQAGAAALDVRPIASAYLR